MLLASAEAPWTAAATAEDELPESVVVGAAVDVAAAPQDAGVLPEVN